MNLAPGAHGYRNAVQQPAGANAGPAQRSADTGARRQLFIDDINKALEDDKQLKAQDPSQGLQQDELTVLLRERDRLAPLCTDEASALTLAEDLGDHVRNVLTVAARQAGLTVVGHDFQCVSSMSAAPAWENTRQVAAIMASQTGRSAESIVYFFKTSLVLGHQLRCGPCDAVTAFMNGLKGLGLNSQQTAEIVAAKDADGKPGLCYALQEGRDAAVKAYMDGLKGLGLDPVQIVDIVAARNSHDDPGLLFALQYGHDAVVTAFMEGLTGLGLGPRRVADTVTAKHSRGYSGLYVAMQNGHGHAVTIFMDGLKGLGLDSQQLFEIVLAKDRYGRPGLGYAMQWGHSNVVTAFLRSLKGLALSRQQVVVIVEARLDGAPGLYHALQSGHTAAVAAFMESLVCLGLHPLDIADIVAARLGDGTPGLTMALRNGHAATVTAFIQGLLPQCQELYERLLDATQLPNELSRLSAEYAIAPDLDLNPQQIADIVAVRNLREGSALVAPRPPRHAAAMQAYMDGLTVLRGQDRITAEQLAELVGIANRSMASKLFECAIS